MQFEACELSSAVKAVVVEIKEALIRFQATGENWTLFIDKMGLALEERQALQGYLGQGGIRIMLEDSAEPAEWQESGVSGVWYGVFYNKTREPILETIEIAAFPQVAMAQPEDVQQGIEKIQKSINQSDN